MRSIPFSAFWLRSCVVSFLVISLIYGARLIQLHDDDLIFLGCVSIWHLAARTRECRLAIAQLP